MELINDLEMPRSAFEHDLKIKLDQFTTSSNLISQITFAYNLGGYQIMVYFHNKFFAQLQLNYDKNKAANVYSYSYNFDDTPLFQNLSHDSYIKVLFQIKTDIEPSFKLFNQKNGQIYFN